MIIWTIDLIFDKKEVVLYADDVPVGVYPNDAKGAEAVDAIIRNTMKNGGVL